MAPTASTAAAAVAATGPRGHRPPRMGEPGASVAGHARSATTSAAIPPSSMAVEPTAVIRRSG